jgi:hypothetical protein
MGTWVTTLCSLAEPALNVIVRACMLSCSETEKYTVSRNDQSNLLVIDVLIRNLNFQHITHLLSIAVILFQNKMSYRTPVIYAVKISGVFQEFFGNS